jgi:hypothetical protein
MEVQAQIFHDLHSGEQFVTPEPLSVLLVAQDIGVAKDHDSTFLRVGFPLPLFAVGSDTVDHTLKASG